MMALLLVAISMPSCKKDYGNLNSPTLEDYSNATKDQLDNLVSGSLSGMRLNEGQYLDVVGVVGREMYRFSNADPRYVTELLVPVIPPLTIQAFILRIRGLHGIAS